MSEQNDEFNASNATCRLSLIIRVNVVLNRTVVVDSDFTYFEMTPGFIPFTKKKIMSYV